MPCLPSISLLFVNSTSSGVQYYFPGEKIGVEYLYSQTGEVLQDNPLNPEDERAREVEDAILETEDEDVVDEGFEEPEDATVPDVKMAFQHHRTPTRGASLRRTVPERTQPAVPESNVSILTT